MAGDARRHGRLLWGSGVADPGKRLYRVFCILEREAEGLPGPSLVIITGLDKPNETAFSKADYRRVRQLGDEYRARSPRSIES